MSEEDQRNELAAAPGTKRSFADAMFGAEGVAGRVVAFALRRRIVRAFLLYEDNRGPMLADSVTYRMLFSIFAGIFLIFSVAGVWLSVNPAAFDALVGALDLAIPGIIGKDAVIDPGELLHPVEFSVMGVLALIGLVSAALGAVSSMRQALRQIADAPPDHTFFVWVVLREVVVALLVGVAFVSAAVLSFFGTSAVGWTFARVGLGDTEYVTFGTDVLSILIIVVLDVLVVALMLRLLHGVRSRAKALWSSALMGGLALTVLQLLSGVIVGGSVGNPLLASFASLITLLLWLNLSSQVMLITGAWLATTIAEERDPVRARFGAQSFPQRRVQRAEDQLATATAELQAAREALEGPR